MDRGATRSTGRHRRRRAPARRRTWPSLVLSQVDYRSAAIADLAGDHGCRTRRRRADAVGPVPLGRFDPGRPPPRRRRPRGGLHLQVPQRRTRCARRSPTCAPTCRPGCRQPIWGWLGRADMFDMAQGYQPQADVGSWLSGTPSMLSLCAVEPGVQLVVGGGDRRDPGEVGAADGTGRLAVRRLARPAGSGPRQPPRPGATGFARDRDAPECTECGNRPDSRGRSSGFSSSRRNPSGNGPVDDEIRRRSRGIGAAPRPPGPLSGRNQPCILQGQTLDATKPHRAGFPSALHPSAPTSRGVTRSVGWRPFLAPVRTPCKRLTP